MELSARGPIGARHVRVTAAPSPSRRSDWYGRIALGFGAFDTVPTDLVPTYELWAARREKWFEVVTGTERFQGNRTAAA